MAIIIKLQEKNNDLSFLNAPFELLCGNSNYQLEIDFDEDWNQFSTKTAVFSINCKNHLIEFSGNTVNVPCLPNGQSMGVYIMCSNEEFGHRITNTLIFNLTPTKIGISEELFNTANNYLAELRSLLNLIEDGSYVIPKATTAKMAENVSNPNLLINGDFKVNQRGQTTYTETSKYTVDRWKLLSGSLEVVSDGIKLNGTITQKLEHAPTGDVVCSVDTTGGNPSISYLNGAVTITTTSATLIKWAKLEVGTTPTIFSPKHYAEELALCQRYYEKIDISNVGNKYRIYGNARTAWGMLNPLISFGITKRTMPTVNLFSSKDDAKGYLFNQTKQLNQQFSVGYNTTQSFQFASSNGDMSTNDIICGYFEADAEIY